MCGIAGVVGAEGVTTQHVDKMIAKIGYRGVDEQGVQDVHGAIIGHARLAVVDPANGMQPMSNHDNTIWVTFNGEIYNYVELREELKSKGYVFKSRCDTEVLVHLWQEEGEAMLDRLIGMFCFFVWDQKTGKGMLARDRQGIKPCYLADYKGGIAFCSEIKGILELPDFPRMIDQNTLLQVFAFNYPPPPATCFKNVRHLQPGTYLRFERNKIPTTHTYWCWPLLEDRSEPSYEEFGALLDDAIRLQMRFDVPGGMFLSGGVDSSVIAHHLVKQWIEPVLHGTSLDFKTDGFSELSRAQSVADQNGIVMHPFEVDPQLIPEIASSVVFHADQPHGDFSFYLFYLLGQAAHKENKIVMFNGDGPDEALLGFGQNERYFSGLGRMNFSARSYFDTICYMNEGMRGKLLTRDFTKNTEEPLDKFLSVIQPWESLDPVEQVSAYELTSLMPGNNLIKGDRMGAASSIEGRAPFLDHRISELFARLPLSAKFKDGVGKYYLKKYAARHYSEESIFRPKSMPTMPIGEWVKTTLYDWAHDIMSGPQDGIFQRDAILQMLKDHQKGYRNHTQQIRTIIMTKLWMKEFF